ncbi:hypothetical protein [Gloeocapsa sp. PCC 73106]|uniref:hypothetical protein n=1 Tax=Gloeocapsa sp. PCC 73106 TaxID=102232 RepID=UPI0002AC8D44|nr:hypothetical protein [Gloeocapsa sp. PCC 73106]ELR97235.1 hypothetical protein GLO73106DRAFT_00010410 [Gloeocapsa sp. PCC 73106]
MELTQNYQWNKTNYVGILKSFLIWTFTLAVCLLVVGFPLIVIMATIGVLSVVILQSVLPMSAVLLVASSIIGLNLLAVIIGAVILTFKGIHPQDVTWLRWLHGQARPLHTSVYAACPLTCEIDQ